MQVLFYSENFLYDLFIIVAIVVFITLAIALVCGTISMCRANKKQREFYEKARKKLSNKKSMVVFNDEK